MLELMLEINMKINLRVSNCISVYIYRLVDFIADGQQSGKRSPYLATSIVSIVLYL